MRRNFAMKAGNYTRLWAGVTIFVVLVTAVWAIAGEKAPEPVKVAVVNGTVINKAEYNRELAIVKQHFSGMGKQPSDAQFAQIKKDLLESLIDRELLYQESQKSGISISEDAINEQLKAMKKQFATEEEFRNALSKLDLSEVSLKNQLKRSMSIQQVIEKQQFGQKATVSDEEAKAYYDSNPSFFEKPEEVQASHILIKVDPKADAAKKAEARKKIEMVQQRIKKGEDFSSLAKEFSECSSSTKGGDLGYFRKGQMVKPFEDAAFTLKPGQMSDIVETQFGYHLIKVTDKKPATKMAFEDVKDKIKETLKKARVQKEITKYVEELKEKAKVERFSLESL
jgi:peptidyl-prolyl cis-trans isomerase C